MAMRCENYATLEECWNKLPPTRLQFFKIMLGNFEHRLFIPKKFVGCFKENISAWCTLVGPSKSKWRVRVSSIDDVPNRLAYLDGWRDFVRDQGIEYGDFIIFKYIKNLTFEVTIFAPSGCEREASHFATNGNRSRILCTSSLHFIDSRGRSEDESVFKEISAEKFKRKCEGISDGAEEKDDSMSEDHQDEETEEEEAEERGEETILYSYFRSRRALGNSTRAKFSQMFYESNRRKLTESDKQRVFRRAEAHKPRSKVPVVYITMCPTYVYRGFNLTIPKKWAIEHMLHRPHEVQLRVPAARKSWKVGCRWTSSQQCQLRANWPTFVLDNNLEEDDICVFELIRKGKSVKGEIMVTPIFDVYIYRVLDDIVPLTVSRRKV